MCTDGSVVMGPALDTADLLARGLGLKARVVLAEAGHSTFDESLRDTASEQANRLGAALDVLPAIEHTFWDVAVPITDYLLSKPNALPVLCAHARRSPTRALLGSVSSGLIGRLSRPIVLLGPDAATIAGFSRVVVCTDGGDLSLEALPVAAGLARDLRLPLWLIEVLEPGTNDAPNLHALANDFAAVGVEANWETLHGRQPASTIVDYLAGDPGTLTVVATHGRSGWRNVLLGSTMIAILRHAKGPIVAVRPFGPQEGESPGGSRP